MSTRAPVIRRPSASAEERSAAAVRRAAGAGQHGYLHSGQRSAATAIMVARCAESMGSSRVVGFPATIRGQKETYNDKQLYHLTGQATVFDTWYEMWDFFGPYEESVVSTALDKSLAAGPDTAFLVNHRGLTMARTIAAPKFEPTLKLGASSGLDVDAWVNPQRSDVNDLVIAVDDGNVTEMSFAFMLLEGWWSDDFMQFKITEADINRGDVSAVNYGANPETWIYARQQELLDTIRQAPVGVAQAALRELLARTDLAEDRRIAEPTRPHPVTAGSARGSGRSMTHVEALLIDLES